MRKFINIFTTILIFVLFFSESLKAEGVSVWEMNGVHTFFGDLLACDFQLLADGEGGVYITWPDSIAQAGISGALYAQHYDSHGNPLWGEGKILAPVSSNKWKGSPRICSDGAGGIVVAWKEKYSDTNSSIMMQRIDSAGNFLWGSTGKCIYQYNYGVVDLVSSLNGNSVLIIASGTTLSVQMLDGNCNMVWPQPKPFFLNYQSPVIKALPDNSGGVILAWLDLRNDSGQVDNADIYAQRIDVNGNVLWQDNGLPVCTADWNQFWPDFCTYSDGSAIVSWSDSRDYNYGNVYAQKIDPNGNILWPINGIPIAPEEGSQRQPVIVNDCEGGAIITWDDWGFGDQACAQRIDGNGNPLWGPNGILVSPTGSVHYNIDAVSDDKGGAIIAWTDCDPIMRYGRYMPTLLSAQHLDKNGNRLWSIAGTNVLSKLKVSGPKWSFMASDAKGGAIINWVSSRNGDWGQGPFSLYTDDDYTQRVSDDYVVNRKSFSYYDGNPEYSERDWDNGDMVAILIDPTSDQKAVEPVSVDFMSECLQGYGDFKARLLSYDNGKPGKDIIPPVNGTMGQCWSSIPISSGTVINDKFFVAIEMGANTYPPRVPELLMDDSPGNYSYYYDSSTASWTKCPHEFYIRLIADTKVPLITGRSLKKGDIWKGYSDIIEIAGGKSPFNFSISSGSMPDGLQLNPLTGEITGICSRSGNFPFSVTLTDSDNKTFTDSFSIAVEGDTPLIYFTFYPNPFNPILGNLKVEYYLTENMNGYIDIYNISGEKVRSISINEVNGGMTGANKIEWDGRNDFGEKCASGIYLFVLDIENGGKKINRKFKVALVK